MTPLPNDEGSKLRVPDAAIIEQEAAEWFVRRRNPLSAEEEKRFQDWLASDPRCSKAMHELEAAWTVVCYPGTGSGQALDAQRQLRAIRHRRKRRRLSVVSLGLAAAAMLGFWLHGVPSWRAEPDKARVVVRPDRQFLPDGSAMERNARTDVELEYSEAERRVRLTRGEALFTVVPDAGRPFLVSAGGIEVQAVGTEFSVRYAPERIDVLVTHGSVAISSKNGITPSGPEAATRLFVGAGDHATVPAGAPLSSASVTRSLAAPEIAAALAWRDRRLEFTRTPLSEVVELFNRRNRVKLALGDAAVGEIRITGLFWADDPDGFVRLLESGFSVTAERKDDVIHLSPSS